MRTKIPAVGLVLALALTACATGSSAPTGPYRVGSAYTVTLGQNWSDVSRMLANSARDVRMLTIDGPILNRLYMVGGIEPGAYIVRPDRRETPTPIYRADMADTELVEFIGDSIAALGYQRPEASNLRPATLAAYPGVRFDVTTQTPEGLNVRGTALVARSGDRLNAMFFLAPTEHYYGATLPEVERVFASAAVQRR